MTCEISLLFYLRSEVSLDMSNFIHARLGRDVKILITSMGIVSLAGGFNQVVQYVYLAMLGISPSLIGIVVSISTVGGR